MAGAEMSGGTLPLTEGSSRDCDDTSALGEDEAGCCGESSVEEVMFGQ